MCAPFDLLQQLFVFFTSSTKRFEVYREEVKESEEQLLMLRNLAVTHWLAREESIRAVMSSYEIILEALDVLSDPKYADPSTRSKAEALQDKIKSFNFLITLMFMKNVIGKTKCWPKKFKIST